jgi:ribokinase
MNENGRLPRTVAVIGSMNADFTVHTDKLPLPGQTVKGSALQISSGGKSANQAVAAALLGAKVAMMGSVGDDEHGRMLRDSVKRAGVDTTAVTISTAPTGTAVIEVDGSGENTIIVSAGANGTLAPDDQAIASLLQGAGVLCLCLEIPIPAVMAAARCGHVSGVQVLLNLSPYAEVPDALFSYSDVLLLNEHEAASLVGRPINKDWGALHTALQERGVKRSVITRGAEGAMVLDVSAKETVVEVTTIQVDAVDTTGSGDAFTGALAARLAAGDDLVDAARFAARAGAWAATKYGTQSSYATLQELEQWECSTT